MDNVRFAQTIKNARLKKGYTQSQLADLLNVSNKTISKWETGRGYPDITLLAKITSILKLDYEELLQSNEYIIQKRKKKRKEKVKRYFYHLYCLSVFYSLFNRNVQRTKTTRL